MSPSAPVAVVTGGNRGIGLEVCRQLVELGYAVVLSSRDLSDGDEPVRRLVDPVSPGGEKRSVRSLSTYGPLDPPDK